MIASRVRSSLCDYLNRQSPERRALRETLNLIAHQLPDIVIFGGMLRDFAIGNARSFTSDIDLVCLATRQEIYTVVQRFSPHQNKFGGFRFISGKRVFDIWALEDTWAFREGLAKPNGLTSLFDTTFFNIDSALFHLSTQEYDFSPKHAEAIKSRTLDTNLIKNPNPRSMARRAITAAIKHDLAISPALSEFILSNTNKHQSGANELMFISALERHLNKFPDVQFQFNPQDPIPDLTS